MGKSRPSSASCPREGKNDTKNQHPLADPAFVPTFRSATVTDGVNVWPLNSNYFASKETAQWIANKYGIGQVIETPFGGSGGPFAASANEYQIKLRDGRAVNAGILAGY